MQQMGRRMIECRGLPKSGIDLGLDPVAAFKLPDLQGAKMNMHTALLLCVTDMKYALRTPQITGIPDLSAPFCIEGAPVEHHDPLLACFYNLSRFTIDKQAGHVALRRHPLIAGEFKIAWEAQRGLQNRYIPPTIKLARRPSALTLSRHLPLETFHIQRQSTLPGDVCGQLDGEAIGIIELKYIFTRDHRVPKLSEGSIEQSE